MRRIPVVVLTTSRAPQDVGRVHDAGAGSFVTKPMRIDEFANALRVIGDFWLGTAACRTDDLPAAGGQPAGVASRTAA